MSSIPLAVFRNPRPDDIMQGVLGDCWLVEIIVFNVAELAGNI